MFLQMVYSQELLETVGGVPGSLSCNISRTCCCWFSTRCANGASAAVLSVSKSAAVI